MGRTKPRTVAASGRPVEHGHLPSLWSEVALHANGRAGSQFVALLSTPNPYSDWNIADRYRDGASINAPAAAKHLGAAAALGNMYQQATLSAPARGRPRPGYSYLPKLNRVYTEISATSNFGRLSFAGRLESAIVACENEVERRSRPADVVLLDSRAGIHDVAAIALTQLGDLCLLFATDNAQTWIGYRDLFSQWRTAGAAAIIRERLRMVASMVPPGSTSEYLASFRDNSQACFADTLYDDAAAGDIEAFNPAPEDDDAPHSPLPILFSTELVGLDPRGRSGWHESDFVVAAFREFLDQVVPLVIGVDDE